MLNPDSLSALFSSSCAIAVYGFLGNYMGEKALDHLLVAKPEQLKSSELISRQLYEALDEALQMTCTEYEWEYDADAISETFSEGENMWAGIDSSAKLIRVLSYAIGDDNGNLITEDVAEFWLDAFSRGVACRQQLFNYLRLTRKPIGLLINFGQPSLQGERYGYDEETNECILLNKNMGPVYA